MVRVWFWHGMQHVATGHRKMTIEDLVQVELIGVFQKPALDSNAPDLVSVLL